jgi:hypothetical protein
LQRLRADTSGWIVSTRFAGTDGVSLETYPSNYEGFGNAFLEAIYFRKPNSCKVLFKELNNLIVKSTGCRYDPNHRIT